MGDDSSKIVPLRPQSGGAEPANLVGRAIRFMRRDRKMTQQELGDLIGVSGTRIQKIEMNVEHISAINLEKIAQAFDVEVSDFFKSDYEAPMGSKRFSDLAALQSECMRLIQTIDDVDGLLVVKDALLKLAR